MADKSITEVAAESRIFSQEEFDKYQLWRFMPVINVDRVKDIPGDWPGLMGVPITYMDKDNRDLFEILDSCRPRIGEKDLYQRLVIRNKRPENTGRYVVTVTYEVENIEERAE